MHKHMISSLLATLLTVMSMLPVYSQEAPFADPPTEQPQVEAPTGPIDPDKVEVTIAFAKADLASVLAFLSLASGVPIIIDADVKGAVTISSMRKVSLSLAYEAINAALRVRGFTMVGTLKDKMIRVVPLKRAFADRAIVQIGNDPDKIGTSDTVITQIIPLESVSAVKLREELKPLVLDDQANLLAVSSTNTLIVTDTEGNIKRLVQIIRQLDKSTTDVLDIEVYQCKYANATLMVDSLEKTFAIGKYATPTMPRPGMPQGGQPGQPGQPTFRTDEGELMTLKGELRISADERTNAIIISAAREKIDVVLALAKKLDINTTSEVRPRVFHLLNADATIVADQLNRMFEQPQGGVSTTRGGFFGFGRQQPETTGYAGLKENIIVADVRTNSLIVTASEQNMIEFEGMIKELDAPNPLSNIARTIQLKYAKAPAVAQVLNQLFRGNTQRMSFRDIFFGNTTNQGDPVATLRGITVVADEKTNTLLLTGPPQAFNMVESIISQLDRRTVQVFIEVAIVDVTLDDATKFGVEWNWCSTGTTASGHPRGEAGTNFNLSEEEQGFRYSILSSNLQALLHTLETRSNVKVYSTPSITTADNIPAKISIGRDEPFVSSETETTGGNLRRTVDFKNVSITLNVTPHVSEGGIGTSKLISLDVQQTINELIGREIELNAPIIANREARTTVMVNDGQTIVIGGIIKENTDRQTRGVPFLSKIPVLGELFKVRDNTTQKSELMVFLTPHILSNEGDVDQTREDQRSKLTDPGPFKTPEKK